MKGLCTTVIFVGTLSSIGWAALSLAEQSREPVSVDSEDSLENLGAHAPEGDSWVLIDAARRRMVVRDGAFTEEYRFALGPSPDEPKREEGDGRTPRGVYRVCNRFRADRFHRFLALSYPDVRDARRAMMLGLISPVDFRPFLTAQRSERCPPWNTPLGGNVGIHGWGHNDSIAPRHEALEDWTDGCIGVTNQEIEQVYQHVEIGTQVVIF